MGQRVERFGIYGGTFSPIHCGHVKAALEFFHRMRLDKLLIIPTAKPPHKEEVAGASAHDRLAMTRLAFSDFEEYKNGKIEVSDFEISRKNKSYTVNTLEHFRCAGRVLYLLMGTDMFLTLDEWYRKEDIFSLSEIVLMRRENNPWNDKLIEEKNAEYIAHFGAKTHFISESPLEVSSTALRLMIAEGESTEGLIPDAVCKYIMENRLYR